PPTTTISTLSLQTLFRSHHHLRNRHELVSLRPIAGKLAIGSDNRLRPVSPKRPVAAIMQEEHISAAHLFAHLPFNLLRWWRIPVVPSDAPHHRLKPQLSRHPEYR